MVSRYLKLNIEQAYQIKKDIKYSENTFYNLSQKVNAYKLLRRKEAVLKNKLKVSLTSLKSKIILMQSTFPEEERKSVEYTIMQKEKQERKLNPPTQRPHPVHPHIKQGTHNDVSQDLEEIRKNLERFK